LVGLIKKTGVELFALNVLSFLFGMSLVAFTLFSAIKTFVLPRSAPDWLVRIVFLSVRRVFTLLLWRARGYRERDRIMAFYAPISLLLLLPTWLSLITIGFTGMFWGLGTMSIYEAFRFSGSSILTIGFAAPTSLVQTILMLTAAAIGLILVALLIAYLPTMYAAFARREILVNMLEVRAGNPPSAIEMLSRFHRIHGLDNLTEQWITWENWFADIEESHTSLPALVFFRSPKPEHSWVNASAAVLDAAALALAALDLPTNPAAALCIRAGYLAFRNIADYFSITYDPNPQFPRTPISIPRADFDNALDELARAGVPLKADRDQSWSDFAGWRVNYDAPLIGLAAITMAPDAPWTGSRPVNNSLPLYFGKKD
jgi:hypothetical protein